MDENFNRLAVSAMALEKVRHCDEAAEYYYDHNNRSYLRSYTTNLLPLYIVKFIRICKNDLVEPSRTLMDPLSFG